MLWKSPKMEKDAHNAVPEYIYNLLVKGFFGFQHPSGNVKILTFYIPVPVGGYG